SGVTVIDESQGPLAGLATMVMADFGAQVTKVEPPGGDPWREMPSAPLWLRGKRSVALQPELAADRRTLLALAECTDVWIRGPLPVAGSPTDSELQQANPRLVIGWVSAFGRSGPYAGYPPYEALVAAKVGRMLQFRGLPARPGPVYAALQVATHATSQSLLSGVLAALRARDRDGVGQVLETSLARGLLPYEMNNVLAAQVNAQRRARGEPELPAPPDPALVMPTLNYHPLRTRDGRWLQMGNLLPHLFMNFLRAIGLDDELAAPWIALPADQWPPERLEALRDRLLMRLQDKELEEWQAMFVADGGVASHPYQSTQQALDDPDALANGHSIPMGETGRQLGLLAHLTRSPGRAGAHVPAVGQHTQAVLDELAGARKPAARAGTSPRGPRAAPLAGITVVEAATIIAAPFGASLLADLGARVIKLEPLEGDPFRGMAPGLGAARVNTGKECIGLDLKQAKAQDIAQRLVARADVFIHNYRPGVPERLGLGYEQLAALNPGLVYVSANGYGPAGPGALRPSTHPIPGAAMGGVLHQIGGAPSTEPMDLAQLREIARRLMRANDVNPDPNTSLVICSTVLLGLQAKWRHGHGQAIFVDMFGANAYANFDDCLRYPGKAPRESPDREGHGLNPLWRLYRCAQGWIFLAIANDTDWQRMRECLGDTMAGVPTLDFSAAREGGEHLIAALQAMFEGAQATAWEARLAGRGVGCVQADAQLPEQFFANDPQALAENLLLPAHHPQWGEYLRHGAQVVLHGTPGVYRGTGVAGGHTGALLSELGFDDAAQQRLRAGSTVA
ncbi:MAG: CoA transferase, partial [Burkholderiaceae bacterium]|nr:CoA transferase [Burkholderiaceae bacterium]